MKHLADEIDRLERIHALAKNRGDLAAMAILRGRIMAVERAYHLSLDG